MTFLGLELSDAGILVAGEKPVRLLEVDGHNIESPGIAIPEKKRLVVGKPAADKAHLFPLQIINRFWDQLNTKPMEKKNRHAQNHAEIASAHLAYIWENVKHQGDEMIIAVPDFYGREQLGLILGMAQELAIPVKGFVSLPVAASYHSYPDETLLHLDIHLHRLEISNLHLGEYLTRENSVSFEEISLEHLYRGWVEAIAEEFVRTTRFDPLHQAVTEQELYNRLPTALKIFKRQSSFVFEISHGRHRYRTTLLRDVLKQKGETIYDGICRFIEQFCHDNNKMYSSVILQITHRIAALPGLKDKLSKLDHCEIVELEPGAGALGILQLWSQLPHDHAEGGAFFFTRRPWQKAEPRASRKILHDIPDNISPTHILYRHVAYPLSEKPLFIGTDHYAFGRGIRVQGSSSDVSKKHCSIQRNAGMIVLTDFSRHGTFVDDRQIEGSTTLELGQIVRLGISKETLRLISCMDTDET